MRTPHRSADESRLLGVGVAVMVALAALTVVEFVVAVARVPAVVVILGAIALVKAAAIVQYFMHVGQLRKGGH